MVDINEWELEYEDFTFGFGYMGPDDNDYPLSVQVTIADPDRTTQDYAQPGTDGGVMGYERLGGTTFAFTIQTTRDISDDPDWKRPLDLFRDFSSAWRADSIREVPGSYATLRNLERGVEVYGRPRQCAPTLDGIRRGSAKWLANFKTIDPNYYSTDETVVDLTGNDTVDLDILGNARTWPSIYMGGSGAANLHLQKLDTISATWIDLWSFTNEVDMSTTGTFPTHHWPTLVPPSAGFSNAGQGAYKNPGTVLDQMVPIFLDTRPWNRGLLTMDPDTGKRDSAQGINTDFSIDEMFIPPSDNLRFKLEAEGTDLAVRVFYRDAYTSL